MRFTSEGAANLRTRNASTLRGAVGALVKGGRGRVDLCRVRGRRQVVAFIALPDDVDCTAMADAARIYGIVPAILIPLSPDDPGGESAPLKPTDERRT